MQMRLPRCLKLWSPQYRNIRFTNKNKENRLWKQLNDAKHIITIVPVQIIWIARYGIAILDFGFPLKLKYVFESVPFKALSCDLTNFIQIAVQFIF